MNVPHYFKLLFLLIISVLGTQSENILAISFFSSRSHKNVYEPLLYELAQRGHTITTVSPYKSSKPHKNYREVTGIDWDQLGGAETRNPFEGRINKTGFNPAAMTPIFEELCHSYYQMPEVVGLVNEKFDLVLASYFWNECTYGIVHKIGAPFILYHSWGPPPSTYSANGNPLPPSIMPLTVLGFGKDMGFKDRLLNSLASVGFYTFEEFTRIPAMERLYKKYLGQDLPSVHEIERNVSLILSNSHFSLHFPRPTLPDLVEVAGMHCRAALPLPKDLEDFIQGSGEHGFIYFSMGSVVQASTMPEKIRKTLVSAFSKLKQRVIWKWETETMPDLPPNVKLGKWLPQQDILGHPKIRLFVTHGGLLSTEEAVYHGVPLVGIPVFGDQDWNMKHSEQMGFARTLELRDLTEEAVLTALNEILAEPRFKQRVQELSAVFRDRPQRPLDDALFWTEYVMRHKGARHMRSAARDLNFFQYYCLDVVAVLVTVLLTILYVLYISARLCLRKVVGVLGGKKLAVSAQKKTK